MTEEKRDIKINSFINKFIREKIVIKYLCPFNRLSGSATIVHPITVTKNKIILQWQSDKRIFDKFIQRTIIEYSHMFKSGHFWKSDGSCPSTITFNLKEEFCLC